MNATIAFCVEVFSVDLFLAFSGLFCACLGWCIVEKYQCAWIPHYGTIHYVIPVCSGMQSYAVFTVVMYFVEFSTFSRFFELMGFTFHYFAVT